MRDLFDAAGLILVALVFMLICAIAVPLGLLVAAVWLPVDALITFFKSLRALRAR
jgi:hypothetical protein